MRIHVDMTRCQVLAQCVFAAPDVFALDDRDELVYEPVPGEDLALDVEQAVRACPVQAIAIEEA